MFGSYETQSGSCVKYVNHAKTVKINLQTLIFFLMIFVVEIRASEGAAAALLAAAASVVAEASVEVSKAVPTAGLGGGVLVMLLVLDQLSALSSRWQATATRPPRQGQRGRSTTTAATPAAAATATAGAAAAATAVAAKLMAAAAMVMSRMAATDSDDMR